MKGRQMTFPRNKENLEGIAVVNKPLGVTSHDVVAQVRRKFNMQQVGHAGTLDPLATGVLIVLLGKATKLFGKFEGYDKAYNATLILGTRTKTADIQGEVFQVAPFEQISRQAVEDVFKHFIGEIQQTPPMVSALKVNGRRLYELARKGVEVERRPRKIKIHTLRLLTFVLPRVKFYLECSKGTYVRKLAEDVGEELGCGACIAEIERTKVGPFTIEESVSLEALTPGHVRPWK